MQDLTLALETRLSLGLPLAQLPEVDRLLEAARLKMTGLRAVAVLDFGEDIASTAETFKVTMPAATAAAGLIRLQQPVA